jgi:hypothetical protein
MKQLIEFLFIPGMAIYLSMGRDTRERPYRHTGLARYKFLQKTEANKVSQSSRNGAHVSVGGGLA